MTTFETEAARVAEQFWSEEFMTFEEIWNSLDFEVNETNNQREMARWYRILGHQYFFYHPLVAADLGALLTTGRTAAERSNLLSKTRDGNRYWAIVDSGQR